MEAILPHRACSVLRLTVRSTREYGGNNIFDMKARAVKLPDLSFSKNWREWNMKKWRMKGKTQKNNRASIIFKSLLMSLRFMLKIRILFEPTTTLNTSPLMHSSTDVPCSRFFENIWYTFHLTNHCGSKSLNQLSSKILIIFSVFFAF